MSACSLCSRASAATSPLPAKALVASPRLRTLTAPQPAAHLPPRRPAHAGDLAFDDLLAHLRPRAARPRHGSEGGTSDGTSSPPCQAPGGAGDLSSVGAGLRRRGPGPSPRRGAAAAAGSGTSRACGRPSPPTSSKRWVARTAGHVVPRTDGAWGARERNSPSRKQTGSREFEQVRSNHVKVR